MNLKRLFESLRGTRCRPSLAARQKFYRRLQLEPLETRDLLAIVGSFSGPLSITVGNNVNISKLGGNQHESAIVVNPTNPENLFAVSNTETSLGNYASYSMDGGVTWNGRLLGTPGDGLPHGDGDPEAVFDPFGNLFLTYLSGEDVVIVQSTDGGKTFTTTVDITATTGGQLDQPNIAAGAGSLWVSYTNENGDVEAAGATVTGLGSVGAFSRQVLPGSNGGDFGDIAIGPTGQVVVTYQYGLINGTGLDTIVVNRNLTGVGGAFGNPVLVTATNVGGSDTNVPAQSNNFGIDAEASLAYDRSGGAFNGRLYLVYTDAATPASSVTRTYLRSSIDNGATWSGRISVFDAGAGANNSEFLPSVSVDQTTGNIGVAWYDCRQDQGLGGVGDTDGIPNDDAELWAAFSTNGGTSFSANVKVSTGASNANDSEPPDDAAFRPLGYGDFNKSDFTAGTFYRVWADNSNSTGNNPDGRLKKMDLYTARVTIGGEAVVATSPAADTSYYLRIDPQGSYVQFFQNNPTLTGSATFSVALAALRLTTITGNIGNDSVTLDFSRGNPIPGGMTYNGSVGTNSLSVNANGNYTLSNTSLVINQGGANTTVNLGNIQVANLTGGAGTSNTFTVTSWSGSGTLDGGGGAGADQFLFTGGDLSNYVGAWTIRNAGSNNSLLQLDDSAFAPSAGTRADYFINTSYVAQNVTSTGTSRSYQFNFDSTLGTLRLDGSNSTTSANTFVVAGNPNTNYVINGAVPPGSPIDTLNLGFWGATSMTLAQTPAQIASGSGVWTAANGRTVIFNGMASYPTTSLTAVAPGGPEFSANNSPLVQIYNSLSGELLYQFYAYPQSFHGGVRVAQTTIPGIGPVLITAPGRGVPGDVKIWALPATLPAKGSILPTSFAPIGQFRAFENNYLYGVNVAVGNAATGGVITGSTVAGVPDIVVGRVLGTSDVQVWKPIVSGGKVTFAAQPAKSFLAYPASSLVGVTVAVGDMNQDGRADVITVPQAGVSALVRVWDGSAINSAAKNSVGLVNNTPVGEINEWLAMPASFRGGVALTVAATGLGGATRPDLIIGAGTAGNSLVQVFAGADVVNTSFRDLQLRNVLQFTAYTDASGKTAPLRLTTRDLLGNGSVAIITAQGPNGRSNNLNAFLIVPSTSSVLPFGTVTIKGPTTQGGVSLA